MMERRRALMTQNVSDVLFSLENHIVTDGDSINTGVKPFVSGRSTTILLDYDQQYETNLTSEAGCRVMYLVTGHLVTGISPEFTIWKYGRTVAKFYHVWMGGEATAIPNVDTHIGRKRILITHAADSGDITIYIKTGSTVETVTVSGTFTVVSHPLLIGGDGFNFGLLRGTINEAKVYNRILSADEITAFFE